MQNMDNYCGVLEVMKVVPRSTRHKHQSQECTFVWVSVRADAGSLVALRCESEVTGVLAALATWPGLRLRLLRNAVPADEMLMHQI